MKFLDTILLGVSLLLSLASAAPVTEQEESRFPPLNPEFYLKTKLIPGQTGKGRFDNLWIVTYHTSASTNDIQLLPKKQHAIPGAFNRTHHHVEFKYSRENYPWSMVISDNEYYSYWQPVEINSGYGFGKFYFKHDELRVGGNYEWTGWLGLSTPLILGEPFVHKLTVIA